MVVPHASPLIALAGGGDWDAIMPLVVGSWADRPEWGLLVQGSFVCCRHLGLAALLAEQASIRWRTT